MDEVVIVAAARTGVGKFGGTLAKIPATELGAHVIKGLLAQTGVDPALISEVILGQVLTAGVGQNAAQAIAVNKEMGWDTSKINVNGGAIAIGHPIGASGCRVLVTLIHEMIRRDVKRGLASLCIGGGMGVALAIER